MLTEFVRDHAFTAGWFGLMAMVWFGWGQEDPPPSWRVRLGVGSGVGVLLALAFGSGVVTRWGDGSALEGRYHWFGLLVAAEVVLALVGCLWLARTGRPRWMAWWVALVVALHFAPLAPLLEDPALAVTALVQVGILALLLPALRRGEGPTSRLVGPAMGATLLLFSVVSGVLFLVRHGLPWA